MGFRRSVLMFLLVFLTLTLAGCGGGGSSGDSTDNPKLGDQTPPTVTGSNPSDGGTNVDNLATVAVTFSEAMDPATLNSTTFTVGDLAGTVTTAGNVATFAPAVGLFPGRTYTATVTTGAADLAGNALAAPFSFSFTVENLAWGGSIQIGEAGIEEAQGVAVDDGGNVYVFGHTDDDLEAPGANSGGDDLFLIKYDPTGAQLLLKQIGSEGDDLAANVVVDKTGNIYLVGLTGGDLGATGALLGEDDAFAAKLSPAGDILWLERFGAAGAPDSAIGVQVDSAGNVYVAGSTGGDLGGGDLFLDADAFLVKFDASGTLLWTNQFGTDGIDDAFALALDTGGRIFVVGSVDGDLNSGAAGLDSDAYLVRFDVDGNGPDLIDQLITDGDDFGTGVVVDSAGNVFIGGRTDGDFTTGGLGTSEDAFIAKFTNGTGIPDILQFGSADFDDALGGLAVDSADNIYITGEIGGDLNGETAFGLGDGYLAKFDGNLNTVWTRIFGTALNDFTTRVAVGPDDGVYVTGITEGDLFKTNLGAVPSDGFLIKFDSAGNEL